MPDPIQAWWLPVLPADRVTRWATLRFGEQDGLVLRVPALTVPELSTVLDAITAARDGYLADLPVLEIVARLDKAVG
ncbi:MAG TPA: acyl-CoA reductase, partial [Candidatus Methylomirabilis sp.]